MLAETAYNVFKALSPEEQQRMLSMVIVAEQPKKKAVKMNNDAQVKEMIILKLLKWNQQRKSY